MKKAEYIKLMKCPICNKEEIDSYLNIDGKKTGVCWACKESIYKSCEEYEKT